MFGTTEEPGLIPKCLQRIFLRAGDHIDKQLLFKPDGLENLMPTTQGDLSTEIAVREYIFPDQEVLYSRQEHSSPNVLDLLATESFGEYHGRTR